MWISNFSWNGQAVWMYEAILYISVAYILLCKLNYGYHNQTRFINIFQKEYFLAVKFSIGYENNMSFLVIAKSPKVKKKVENIGLGSFNKVHGPIFQNLVFFFSSQFVIFKLYWKCYITAKSSKVNSQPAVCASKSKDTQHTEQSLRSCMTIVWTRTCWMPAYTGSAVLSFIIFGRIHCMQTVHLIIFCPMIQCNKLILISGCYENCCENRFCKSCLIWGPVVLTVC